MLDRCAEMDAERAKLRRMGEALRQAFGANTIAGDSQIVPFLIGGDREAVEKANYFLENGFLVFAIRPPTVPPNGARLRFSLSAALPEESIEQLRRLI